METTNFFSSIAALNITGDLQVTIRKGAESNWIVSVMLNNEQCGDDARKLIPPLNLRGSAEELDNGFFERITTPIQTASGLMVDMEGFMKQLEEVKKQSAMEKEKTDRERKEKEAKEKKYREAMQKVDELEKEGKHRDAWMKVPDPSEYPEQAEAIRKRKSSLSSKFAPDLFGATATPLTVEQPQSDEANVEEEETNQ
ncbi:MAG: prtrc system protein e [Bacteroidetes bacterium]|jgi:PRTRC genetic system protein E|nr:prtrc system protein e [Bacteroidota bacterium]MBS1748873.1 prtrc system protein e [Bacteroidota bacterium]MBX3255665.1 prtrc system protein e [Chitinophagaceae bacterium]